MSIRIILFSAIECLALALFLFGALWIGLTTLRDTNRWKRWLALPSSFLIAVGAVGFFCCGISYTGGLDWLPSAFEWPAGFVDGVLTTSSHGRIVLIKPAGRVQVYDPAWRFLRGWPVSAGLKLRLLQDGTVEVLTKGQKGFVFDLNGRLLSQETYAVRDFLDLENSLPAGESIFVPTPWWLYVFSSPFLSWLVMLSGFMPVMLLGRWGLMSPTDSP
jgi:hypothetical protein